jgi:hypothetical protein
MKFCKEMIKQFMANAGEYARACSYAGCRCPEPVAA